MKKKMILGIDMAKAKFDACLGLGPGQRKEQSFANTLEGFAQLKSWLGAFAPGELEVGIEATGSYWMALAHELYQAGAKVFLLNPAYVKAHGQSEGRRCKTDRVDARLIADYVCKHECEAWTPLPAELEQLRELMRLYADVTAAAASLAQRREGLRTALAQRLQAEITAALRDFAKKVLHSARAHACQHPSLERPMRCLETIKGIGPVTALILTAELPRQRAARSVAGWAGVTPRIFVSGETVHKRPKLCKQGSDFVRHSLYWPAITALRCNPAMQAFGNRLQQAGLNKMQIVGAVMHKLLRWAVGVINSEKPFDPSLHALT
jgi:transposase